MKKYLLFSLLFFLFNYKAYSQEVINSKKIESSVDNLIRSYTTLDMFSGVVLVAEKGEIKYHKAFGMANRETHQLNTLQTRFNIGSMNKTLTKMIILQLVEQGSIKLDDTVGDYLQGFPSGIANKSKIYQLLSHTGGLGDYYSTEFLSLPLSKRTPRYILNLVKEEGLVYEPGSEQIYSNSGYIVLGAIIEAVTGKSYNRNVEERILTPLNLNNISTSKYDKIDNRAIGYFKDMRGNIFNNEDFMDAPKADGGFYSTALDVYKFYQEFHYGEHIIQRETKIKDEFFQMFQEQQTTGGAIPHAGGFNGANTVNYEILRDNITVVVMANMDEPVAEQLGAGILAIIRNQTPNQPSLPARQMIYRAYKDHGIEYVKNNFEELTLNFHPTDPKDLILNEIGYSFIEAQELEDAINIFKLNTDLFPDVANTWDSLSDAYILKGEVNKAITSLKTAIKLDPNSQLFKNKLQGLKEDK